MNIHLNHKVAIITGGSRGIGESIAKTFASHGAKVVVASRKQESVDRVAQAINASGGDALALVCHTGSEEGITALVEQTVSHFGQVDVLVNNAATNPYFGPLVEADLGAWQKTFDINVRGYFLATREVVKHFRTRSSGGSIINIASVAAHMAMPLQGIYAMSKAAVVSMTKTMAMELGRESIRINAICPGLVDTKFASALTTDEAIMKEVLSKMALKHIGKPEDIANLALYLASDASGYMTGEAVVIDGGWTI